MAAAKKLTEDYFELTGRTLPSSSLLRMFNIMQDEDDIEFMNMFRSYTIYDETLKDTVYFQTYEMENEDWWETIAYKMYGSVNLWWVICLANNITNPFEETEAGKNIKLLHERFVPQLIREIRNISEL